MSLIWKRGDLTLTEFYGADDPLEHGERIRKALAMIAADLLKTDTLVATGTADFGKDIPLCLPPTNYVGVGATWRHSIEIDKTPNKPMGTPGFLLGEYAKFTDMVFVGRCHNPQEDGGLIGWNLAMDAEVIFENTTLDGAERCDWVFYNWTPGRKSVIVRGGKLLYCRQGFSLVDSSGAGQSIEITKLTAIGNAIGSQTFGESSSNDPIKGGVLSPVVMRGGKATIRRSEFKALGLPGEYDPNGKYGCPRIAGIVTDQYYSDGQSCEIVVDSCRSQIVRGTAKVFNDIDVRRSTLMVIRDEGCGENGSFRTWK